MVAYSRAMRAMVEAGTAVMASAHCGVLGRAVASAEDVIGVTLRTVNGHLSGVEADAMRANEFGIVEVLGEHHVGHGAHHGGVGAGANGDPLVGERGGAERVARVDANDARAGLTGQLEEVIAVGAVAHLGGVPTPHQDVFGIEPVLPLIAGDEGAVHGGRGEIDGAPRIGVVDAQAAAEEIQQATGDMRAIELVVGAGAIGNEQRGVAVTVLDALHFAGKGVERLVPGNGGELALAAFAECA